MTNETHANITGVLLGRVNQQDKTIAMLLNANEELIKAVEKSKAVDFRRDEHLGKALSIMESL